MSPLKDHGGMIVRELKVWPAETGMFRYATVPPGHAEEVSEASVDSQQSPLIHFKNLHSVSQDSVAKPWSHNGNLWGREVPFPHISMFCFEYWY